MKTAFVILLLSIRTLAATYYVDPAGSNGNTGLSPAAPWRTLLKVGISTFQPGDTILFKRDGVWNEWLTPPSSGAAGNLIKFDAYGSGRPPEFTGAYATTAAQWTNVSGSVWQIALSATQAISQLNFVRFGTIWGNGKSAQNLLAHDRDWYYDAVAQNLYVWSAGGNPASYYASVTPMEHPKYFEPGDGAEFSESQRPTNGEQVARAGFQIRSVGGSVRSVLARERIEFASGCCHVGRFEFVWRDIDVEYTAGELPPQYETELGNHLLCRCSDRQRDGCEAGVFFSGD